MGSFGAVKSSSQGWKSWVLQVSPDSTLLGSLPTFSARHSQKHPKEICFERWDLQVKVSRSVCFRNLSRSLVNLDLAKENIIKSGKTATKCCWANTFRLSSYNTTYHISNKWGRNVYSSCCRAFNLHKLETSRLLETIFWHLDHKWACFKGLSLPKLFKNTTQKSVVRF